MTVDRRHILAAGLLTAGVAASGAVAGPRERVSRQEGGAGLAPSGVPGSDQTDAIAALIAAARAKGEPAMLPAGRFRVGGLQLGKGTVLIGARGKTILEFSGAAPSFISAKSAAGIAIDGVVFDGARLGLDANVSTALLSFTDCLDLKLSDVEIVNGLLDGLELKGCSGRISDSRIRWMGRAGLFSLDAKGLSVCHSEISDCSDNGVLVWRSAKGYDGTLVQSNRIERIATKSGGSGENGNGVNVYRAGSVVVQGNVVRDCAYSAVRGNSADNIVIQGNSASGIGEVALYAEFGFEGASIIGNVVDGSASGIAVTNFNVGGRLAVVQGNLVRNLTRREHEPVDKRGEGISVEADAVVSGNVVEAAQTAGITGGYGKFMRDIVITGNIVRGAPIGISISASDGAGTAVVSQNLISGAKGGAIVAFDHDKRLEGDLAREPSKDPRLVISGNTVV